MKTVRFDKLVEQSGQPEVYLLLSDPKQDSDFQRALKARRVLTLHRDKTDFGTPGYSPGRQSQILIFPRTLKIPEEARVVGIHYDLLKQELSAPHKEPGKAAKSPVKAARKHAPKKEAKEPAPSGKVISFPKPEPKEDDSEDERTSELKAGIRRAMKALEEGKEVAAFNLLKRLVE